MTKKMTLLERQEKLNAAKEKKAKSSKAAKSTKTAKASKPVKAKKAAKVKVVKDDTMVGHNSNGKVNEALVALFNDYEELDANKKEIGKAQRDIRARAKEEFGVQSNVFSDQIRKRKMDADVRAQFEHGVTDLENMIGYQMSLALSAPGDDEGEEPDDADNNGDSYHSDAGDDEQLAAGGVH